MSADSGGHAQRQWPAAEVLAAFDADNPQRLRLAAAVHEAGHVIVASTTGWIVTRAGVCDCAADGCRDRGMEVDFRGFGTPDLPDVLAVTAAGYQAMFAWLSSGGIDGHVPPYDAALQIMAADDFNECLDTCRQLGRLDLGMRDGIEGAWRILACRWRAVLDLACLLDSRGVLTRAELRSLLAADQMRRDEAIVSYRSWRRATSDLWRRQPGKPAVVSRRVPAGQREICALVSCCPAPGLG